MTQDDSKTIDFVADQDLLAGQMNALAGEMNADAGSVVDYRPAAIRLRRQR